MPAPKVLERGQQGYPERLERLTNPPRQIYVRGAIPDGPAVAIVGSRSANRQGLRIAHELASDVARAGVTVVSGGARGIDWAAHTGALEGGGQTVMVLGCGHGVEYPKGCIALREQVSDAGAVISELPEDAKPRPLNFPKRNRIVAALAEALVVVQAGERSGALVTAKLAKGLDAPVLAVPGLPNTALTRGTHGLLRKGAILAESANDILTAIGLEPMREGACESLSGEGSPHLEGLHEAVAKWLDSGPASPDEMARGLKRPVGDVLATLVELEMEGLVSSHGGCYERRMPRG